MATETIPLFTMGDRLRKARERAGLTQQELAAEIEISPRTVNRYENDEVKPSRLALRAWAQRTEVPLEWLQAEDVRPANPTVPRGRTAGRRGTDEQAEPEITCFTTIAGRAA